MLVKELVALLLQEDQEREIYYNNDGLTEEVDELINRDNGIGGFNLTIF